MSPLYNFEKWNGAQEGRPPYIKFNKYQMYIPMCVLKRTKYRAFDLLVDKDKRIFALKFYPNGSIKINTEPSQISISAFVATYSPLIKEQLLLKKVKKESEDSDTWIGHLDGKEIADEPKII
jgi:hypothetical protein